MQITPTESEIDEYERNNNKKQENVIGEFTSRVDLRKNESEATSLTSDYRHF